MIINVLQKTKGSESRPKIVSVHSMFVFMQKMPKSGFLREIEELSKKRDSLVFEPWPINEILDKTENLNKQIFILKHQANESSTQNMP